MSDWSHEFTMKFLELYRNEPFIWDSTHKDRKNVYAAWLRLSEGLQRSVKELKRKKDSLMATFRSQLRKKKASIRYGASEADIYKPVWFAYDFMEAFLVPVNEKSTDMDTQDTVYENKSQTLLDLKQEIQQVISELNKQIEFSDVSGTDDNEGIRKVVETIEDSKNIMRKPTVSATSTNKAKRLTATVQRRGKSPVPEKTDNQTKDAVNILNNIISKRSHDMTDDEYDLYGKILAKKLRKLPEHERTLLMYEIDGLFIKAMNPCKK